jgi:hypothetical protein
MPNLESDFSERYAKIRQELLDSHGDVHVILAPPRTCSTTLVRVYWQHPTIGYYNNEPFDRYYHQRHPVETALDHLQHSAEDTPGANGARGLVLKEMTFQPGDYYELLLDLSTAPVVFVIRDPRQSIASRMEMVAAGGGDPIFPTEQSGWAALREQVRHCRETGREYSIVDAADFRSAPVATLTPLFARAGLTFDEAQTRWSPAPYMRMGNLDGMQANVYVRSLASTGIQPPDEPVPDLGSFPVTGGFRDHVEEALGIYRELSNDPGRITAEGRER